MCLYFFTPCNFAQVRFHEFTFRAVAAGVDGVVGASDGDRAFAASVGGRRGVILKAQEPISRAGMDATDLF
jgi:hypothetical protein